MGLLNEIHEKRINPDYEKERRFEFDVWRSVVNENLISFNIKNDRTRLVFSKYMEEIDKIASKYDFNSVKAKDPNGKKKKMCDKMKEEILKFLEDNGEVSL
jgi:hypothetical protein